MVLPSSFTSDSTLPPMPIRSMCVTSVDSLPLQTCRRRHSSAEAVKTKHRYVQSLDIILGLASCGLVWRASPSLLAHVEEEEGYPDYVSDSYNILWLHIINCAYFFFTDLSNQHSLCLQAAVPGTHVNEYCSSYHDHLNSSLTNSFLSKLSMNIPLYTYYTS